VLTDAPGADSFGADGGHIQSITINGVTHNYSPGDATHITGTDKDGGKLTFYFADDSDGHHAGDYSYTAPASVTGDQTEIFHYVLVDGDGDMAEADLTITVKDIPNAPPQLALHGGEYVLDQFESQSYGNNDGSVDWVGNWSEGNDGGGSNGGVTSGDIRISGDQLQFGTGADGGETVTRHVDLSGASSATLTFNYDPAHLTNGRDVLVQAWNGTSWHTLDTISGDSSGDFKATLGANDLRADGGIRFVAEGSWNVNGSNNDGSLDIDNVKVTYTLNSPDTNVTASFTEGDAATPVAHVSSITDADDTMISAATVMLTNEHAGDFLAVDGTQLHDGSTGSVNGINYTVADNGSSITVNFAGDHTLSDYQATLDAIGFGSSSQNPSEDSRLVDVTVTDAHGNVSNTAETTIAVHAVNDDPVVGDLTVVSNFGSSSFTVPDAAFLNYATDPDGDSLSVNGVSNASGFNGGGSVSHSNANDIITINDNNSPGASFDFTVTDGHGGNIVGSVTYEPDTTGTISGTNGDDIIVGNSSSSSLDGHDGDDTLIGGGGRDNLTGGDGADHFFYASSSDGGGSTGDHILDFNDAEGDTIDVLLSGFAGLNPADVGKTADQIAGLFDSNTTGTEASTNDARFHFDAANHTLYYDADGSGGAASIALAHLDNDATVQAHNVHLV
jgi:hypothetical protein